MQTGMPEACRSHKHGLLVCVQGALNGMHETYVSHRGSASPVLHVLCEDANICFPDKVGNRPCVACNVEADNNRCYSLAHLAHVFVQASPLAHMCLRGALQPLSCMYQATCLGGCLPGLVWHATQKQIIIHATA